MTSAELSLHPDARFMALALAEADRAAELGEVPVGCVIVAADGTLLGAGHNLRESTQDPTQHAEIVAIRAAAARTGSWRLSGTTLYVTLEPCPMCAGALVNARIARLVYGCDDPKAGATRTLYRIPEDTRLNHRLEVVPGVAAQPCADRLRRFFLALRTG
jgi:tRNA(adenine34) deaminase